MLCLFLALYLSPNQTSKHHGNHKRNHASGANPFKTDRTSFAEKKLIRSKIYGKKTTPPYATSETKTESELTFPAPPPRYGLSEEERREEEKVWEMEEAKRQKVLKTTETKRKALKEDLKEFWRTHIWTQPCQHGRYRCSVLQCEDRGACFAYQRILNVGT